MALPDLDTSVGHSFGLEVDGVTVARVVEVSGLTMEQDVVEVKENTADGKFVVRKLPGRPKAGEVTLTRGLTADQGFQRWITELRADETQAPRTDAAIVIFDAEGAPIRRCRLANAWPRRLEIGTLQAGGRSVLVEKLTVAYELLDIE